MIKIADIKSYSNGRKKITFFQLGIYDLLKEKLGFRFTRIEGKGYFFREVKGLYHKVEFWEIKDAFVDFIKNEFDFLDISKEISRDDFLNEIYGQRPIRNGTYIREYLSKDFQLSEANRMIILNNNS